MLEILSFYIIAFFSFAVGIAIIPITFIEKTPIALYYMHFKNRKAFTWLVFFILIAWVVFIFLQNGNFYLWTIVPILLSALAILVTYKLHPENAFKAIDYPEFTNDISSLPIEKDSEIAVIEYEGITKCYPLDFVIHHHIVNDKFASKIVALTYCAMCRSVIPFDVTDIGPLFVAALKNGNMVVADRKTKTFFQQSTFQSMIGKLHPSELKMISFQVLSWGDVVKSISEPLVVKVDKKDFRAFELPIPGAWEKVVSGELVPGVSLKSRDRTFPARTRIIGIYPTPQRDPLVYLRKEVLAEKMHVNRKDGFFLLGSSNTIVAFKNKIDENELNISFDKGIIVDLESGSRWDMRGKYISGQLSSDLERVQVSDEYWFSWKRNYPKSKLIQLSGQ